MNKSFFILSFLLISILSCKKDNDPCDEMICFNDGICVNGTCDCPENWTDPSCLTQKTPSQINITDIIVTSFPATNKNGAPWDPGSDADIFVVFQDQDENIIYEHPDSLRIEDADPNGIHVFDIVPDLQIKEIDLFTSVLLVDYDSPMSKEVIKGTAFKMYHEENNFPDTITLDAGKGFSFDLVLEYEF